MADDIMDISKVLKIAERSSPAPGMRAWLTP